MRERVLMAMSGGVDSSVAAARLVAQGWEVIGVTLHLWDYPDDGSVRGRCCAPEDVHDAQRVSHALGIPHYSFDRRELFREQVVTPFVEAYLTGTTPSPCVQCNRTVKLTELVALADRLGARWVATGHYAGADRSRGTPKLLRAIDRNKDQSYFLYATGPQLLSRLMFPLHRATKTEVRDEARRLGLPGAHKGESQELCFVPSGRYDHFVADRAPDRLRPGPIVDEAGRTVGYHEGIHRFTIGQRRNLGVSLGRRLYVTGLDHQSATVHLGSGSELLCAGARLDDAVFPWGRAPPFDCQLVVRYRGKPVAARVGALEQGKVVAHFREPVAAVAPGQVAVLYDGEVVLGGGVIAAAVRAPKCDGSIGVSVEGPP